MKPNFAFLLPVIAVALLAATFFAPTYSEDERLPSRVSVTESAYACPAGSAITVAAGQLRAGTGASAAVLPARTQDEALADPTSWRTSVVDGAGVIVEQQGGGSGPVGFFGGTAPKAGGGGLIVGACPSVIDDAWLLGLGSGGGHFSTLILTNLADAPAVVDLDLWGPEGAIDAVDAEGIVVDPFTTRRIRLEDLAAGEPALALRVNRRRGALSVAVNDRMKGVFRGTEPVTATAAPRLSQVVGGLVEGATGRTLVLLNPGGSTARVDVEVIGPKNTFTPSGLEQIKVPAGSVQEIAVRGSAGSGRQALRLTSDRPVSAIVRIAPNTKDYAYAESLDPLTGPAVVPVDLGKAAGAPDLVLSAPGRTASVNVRAYTSAMKQVGATSVTIKGGTTDNIDTGKAFDGLDVAYLVLRPKGEVIAAATYVKGAGISSLALTAAPLTVLGPQVRPLG